MCPSLSLPPTRESLGSPDVFETPGGSPPLLLGAGIEGLRHHSWLGCLSSLRCFVFVVSYWNCLFVFGLLFVVQCVC